MNQDIPDCLRGRIDDPLWRLSYLYWIENKQGQMQRFKPNPAQLRLHQGMGARKAVLKARQLGISTYVSLLILDHCLFTPNFHAGIIDKSLPDGEQKISKMRFAWENLDYLPAHANEQEQALATLGGLIKQHTGQVRSLQISPTSDTRTRLGFANGSEVRLGTTLRGGTLQFLHISELAHVSLHSPWRAHEIRTGAINTVPLSGQIILESTHEGGRYGVNYEIMTQAMENRAKGDPSPLDFEFYFFSWFDHQEYQLEGRAHWGEKQACYFEQLQNRYGIKLSQEQKLWYSRMERSMGIAMKQEYPSNADEAFASAQDGSIYGNQFAQLREEGRVGLNIATKHDEPLYTSWDLGLSDHTAIWLIQCYGGQIYWLDHYAINQQGISHFVQHIKKWEAQYGRIENHFLPHDAAHRDPHGHSYVESLAKLGITNVRVIPRTPDIWRGINVLRQLLLKSWFHSRTLKGLISPRGEEEPSGLRCLEMYRTTPPSSTGNQRDTPLHDACSHSADAARYFAEASSHAMLKSINSATKSKRALM